VAPGAVVTFTFTINAPSTPGAYKFQWQMLQVGVGWFGDRTANVQVPVLSPVLDEARFVIQFVPATMTAGQPYDVGIKMRNTGASTWTAAGGYKRFRKTTGNAQWSVTGGEIPASASTGATCQQAG
jgi:hypothetical protein